MNQALYSSIMQHHKQPFQRDQLINIIVKLQRLGYKLIENNGTVSFFKLNNIIVGLGKRNDKNFIQILGYKNINPHAEEYNNSKVRNWSGD